MKSTISLAVCILMMGGMAGCDKQPSSESATAVAELTTTTEATGKFVINPQFGNALGFKEDLAAVRIGGYETGKWGYIDRQGKMVINPQFGYAFGFEDGLAPVRIGDDKTGKWGYISR